MTGQPSSGPGTTGNGWRRPRSRTDGRRPGGDTARMSGQTGQAAAGATDGALGRARPAASGSRWRRNAAHHDFSRRPAARLTRGPDVTARARRVLPARTVTIRPATTADRMAALSAPKAAWPAHTQPAPAHMTARRLRTPPPIPG